jgi:hypothetical protein
MVKTLFPTVDPAVVACVAKLKALPTAADLKSFRGVAKWPNSDFVARVGGGAWRIDWTPAATAQQKSDTLTAVAAFDQSPLVTAQDAETARLAGIKADANTVAMLNMLTTKTAAQMLTYVTNNVTTQAQNQKAFAQILNALSLIWAKVK